MSADANHWKARALAAEAAIVQAQAALDDATTRLDAIAMMQRERAVLISIAQDGRVLRFTFTRNGALVVCETYGTLDQDVPGWKRDLLEPLPHE